MAGDKKISELDELAETPAADDFVAIVDTDASATKKIKPVNLHGGYVTDGELTTHETDTSTHGVSEVDGVTERDSAISTHSADTTAVHGIADTSALALTTDLETHEADTSTHGVTEIDGVTERDSAISTHNSDTTSVHGITDTAALATDAELSTHAALDTTVHGSGSDVLATDADITTHAALDTGVHGAGGDVIATDADITTHAGLDTGVHGAGGDVIATDADITTHAALTATHGASDIADVSDIAVDGNLSVNAQNAVTNRHAESHSVVSHNDTTATGANLNTLVGSGETALHSHAEKGTTDDHADISANDAATDVTGAQLEELSDGSTTTLHNHADQGTTDDYGGISANDAATGVTGAELEELSDGSTTTLHNHADQGTTDDYSDISANDGATDVTGAELEELTDGSTTTKHNHITRNVAIDSIPDSDNTAEGIKSALVAGENIEFPQVCYQNADGEIYLGDADQAGEYPAFCMALETRTDGQACVVLMQGFVRDDDWTWTVGGIIYLSDTPGGLTQTAPSTDGDQIQVLGMATHADRIWFNPQLVVVEHS